MLALCKNEGVAPEPLRNCEARVKVIHNTQIAEEIATLRQYMSGRLEAIDYNEEQAWALVVAMGALFEHIISPLRADDQRAIRKYVDAA